MPPKEDGKELRCVDSPHPERLHHAETSIQILAANMPHESWLLVIPRDLRDGRTEFTW